MQKNRPPEIGREQARIVLDVTKLLGVKLNQLTAAKLFEGTEIDRVSSITRTDKAIEIEVVIKLRVNNE